ncbi:MAG TPA: prepilin peptidase [Allosphingosinicella sp.]|jgi:prepilin peptidase CpaA
MDGISANLPVAILAAMLIVAAFGDLRSRRIPNKLNLAIAALAVPFWVLSGYAFWPDMAVQLALGAGVFLVFAMLFHFGQMGGGDVKLLAALALWLPLASLIKLAVIMSLAGGVLTLVMLIRHRAAKSGETLEVPYGVAIAFAGIWLIGERFLYQFG